MKNKILKKTATILIAIVIAFFGVAVVDSFADGQVTASATQFGSQLTDTFIETAHAQTSNQSSAGDKSKEVYNQIVSVIVVVIEFLSALLWPILLLIGSLLQNDILFSGGMEQTMLNIWVNVRNLVNILFILVLLGIAFYNVMGGSAEDYQLKSILPKFIVALIAVNFSFLAVRLVADTVNVFTIAIFSLPNTVQEELKTLNDKEAPNKICKEWAKRSGVLERNPTTASQSADPSNAKTSTGILNFASMCKEDETTSGKFEFSSTGKQFFDTFSANNAALVMAIDMGKIINIDEVSLKSESANPLLDLSINVLMTAVLYIIYTSGFLALFIILVVRMILLWVTAILSPLVVLRYVLPESIKSAIGGGDDLSKKLIQSIIAPIPIALMMTIGFIMFQSLKAVNVNNSIVNATTADLNLLTSGISTFQDLIIAVGMVAVIWMGVFAAASGTFAEEAVNGIKGAVEGAGKFIATAPFKYLPIIPVRQGGKDGGDAVSAGVALGALQQLPRQMESEFYDDTRSLANIFRGKGDLSKLKFNGANTDKEVANRFVKAGLPTDGGAQKKLHDHLKGNQALLAAIASDFKMQPDKLLDLLEDGNLDEQRLRAYIRGKATIEETEPVKSKYTHFSKLERNSTKPEDRAVFGAFDTATQSKLDNKKTTSESDQKRINQSIVDLNSKWTEGGKTDVDQLDEFVDQSKNEITKILVDGGVAPTQAPAKATEFLKKILEEKKKTATPDDATKIDAAIARLTGATPPAAPPATGTPPATP